jgi:hypothetical protein
VAIELPEFGRRWERKLKKGRESLRELYDRTCPVDAGAISELGTCKTCGRQIKEPPEPDPIPPGTQIPVDPEKAELQKQFYKRVNAQQKEREQRAAAKTKHTSEADESADPPKRDWVGVLDQIGLRKRYW